MSYRELHTRQGLRMKDGRNRLSPMRNVPRLPTIVREPVIKNIDKMLVSLGVNTPPPTKLKKRVSVVERVDSLYGLHRKSTLRNVDTEKHVSASASSRDLTSVRKVVKFDIDPNGDDTVYVTTNGHSVHVTKHGRMDNSLKFTMSEDELLMVADDFLTITSVTRTKTMERSEVMNYFNVSHDIGRWLMPKIEMFDIVSFLRLSSVMFYTARDNYDIYTALFMILDPNNDDRIDAVEFDRLLEVIDIHSGDIEKNVMFILVDDDDDGEITQDELIHFMSRDKELVRAVDQIRKKLDTIQFYVDSISVFN